MWSLLRSLLARLTRRDAPPPALALAPGAAARPARPAAAERARIDARAAPPGLGARRPLVHVSGRLAGFEFQAAGLLPCRLPDGQVDPVTAARTGNLLGAMRLTLKQGLQPLAELPAGWLAWHLDKGTLAAGMHLVLGADPDWTQRAGLTDLVGRLRAVGVLVGWRPARPGDPAVPAGTPDFALLPDPPARLAGADAWRTAMREVLADWPGVGFVLLDLPDVDLLEELLVPPVLMSGCVPTPGSGQNSRVQALPPQARLLMRLINRLVRDDDPGLIVADIKSDAALGLRLLAWINSAGMSHDGQPVASIEQAVALLGRSQIYRWASQALVRLSPPRPAGLALQATALARARLLELLGAREGQGDPGGLYLLGLASMLPLLLQCSLDEALGQLALPEAAVQALREREGPWLRHLALMHALERHDLLAAESLAQTWGGLDTVLAMADDAWRMAGAEGSPVQPSPAPPPHEIGQPA
ncbi:MAG: hypothetical protein RIQ53_151 [Pseudomonadota bacterium]